MNILLFLLSAVITTTHEAQIVTLDHSLAPILHCPAQEFAPDEWPLAQEIAQQLIDTLTPKMPAAGLAAPQIAIARSIFIFSYDRTPEHLEVAINPSYTPLDQVVVEGWEGCFSAQLQDGSFRAAKLPRYDQIHVTYYNLEGKKIEKDLTGFAAKVFQHEWDHLQGTLCVEKHPEMTQTFPSKEAFIEFIEMVKQEDSKRYIAPSS